MITVDLGAGSTMGAVAAAINADAAASLLIQASVDGIAATPVGTQQTVYAPISLLEPGTALAPQPILGHLGLIPMQSTFAVLCFRVRSIRSITGWSCWAETMIPAIAI
ncbi:MAG: hypothetical protein R3C05_27195 [Pirellulaceae bacterium]